MSDDFPTFDRPTTATSGPRSERSSDRFADITNCSCRGLLIGPMLPHRGDRRAGGRAQGITDTAMIGPVGQGGAFAPRLPWKGTSPNVKMPPSAATIK